MDERAQGFSGDVYERTAARDEKHALRSSEIAIPLQNRAAELVDATLSTRHEAKSQSFLERWQTGIKYVPEKEVPPLPRNGRTHSTMRIAGYFGEFLRRVGRVAYHSAGASVPMFTTAVVAGIAAFLLMGGESTLGVALGFSAPLLLGVLVGAGVVGILIYRSLLDRDKFGFGPHKPSREDRTRRGVSLHRPGFYAKNDEKENAGYYYLAEKSVRKRQVKKVTNRIAEIRTVEEMKKITDDPNYMMEEGTGGHCTVHNGKIYVVLEKFKFRIYRKNKPAETRFNYINLNLGLFKIYVEWGGRSRYSLAHELGHAIEFYSRGNTGQLSQFHATRLPLMNDMVRLVLQGLPHSWFHDNTPEPLEPPKEPKENAWKITKERYKRKYAEYERKVKKQEHWNYEELFAEMVALYLLRPEWLRRQNPEAADLIRNLIHNSPMAKHLMLR
ncbi:MAG: hypothetical protein RLZZ283_391 [Candidatus Parcubacteria bacterium]|jgi:hypothetical protein